jgi:hypothetical protein
LEVRSDGERTEVAEIGWSVCTVRRKPGETSNKLAACKKSSYYNDPLNRARRSTPAFVVAAERSIAPAAMTRVLDGSWNAAAAKDRDVLLFHLPLLAANAASLTHSVRL